MVWNGSVRGAMGKGRTVQNKVWLEEIVLHCEVRMRRHLVLMQLSAVDILVVIQTTLSSPPTYTIVIQLIPLKRFTTE